MWRAIRVQGVGRELGSAASLGEALGAADGEDSGAIEHMDITVPEPGRDENREAGSDRERARVGSSFGGCCEREESRTMRFEGGEGRRVPARLREMLASSFPLADSAAASASRMDAFRLKEGVMEMAFSTTLGIGQGENIRRDRVCVERGVISAKQ